MAPVEEAPGADDDRWMALALAEAAAAAAEGEVPIGAVVVRDGELLGAAHNAPISRGDPTAHAEISALRAAALAAGNYRLPGTTVYVTVEPCLMCAGALSHARVARVVFGAREPKSGALVSCARVFEGPGLNHRPAVTEGVREAECAELLRAFFAERRRAGATVTSAGCGARS